MDVEIRRGDPADWRAARDVRLQALADAPDAFAASWARDAALDEAAWRARLDGAAWSLAYRGARAVGVAVGVGEPDVDDARMLVSMWVAPPERGSGVAGALVEAVAGWARQEGARLLTLRVVDGNARARRFYARLGFLPDGARQPLPGRPELMESRLRRCARHPCVSLTDSG